MLGEQAARNEGLATFRWWFLPGWLGLDAPCVALTWTWAVSRATHERLAVRPAVALFLVVWAIYLADRLLDVVRCRDWAKATGRLRFGSRWRRSFCVGIGCCIAGLLGVLWAGLPEEVLRRGAVVAAGVCLHYLVFVVPVVFRVNVPGKELGVGVFFALGAYACLGATSSTLPYLAAIALVVALNCLVIAARDAESDRANDPRAASRWWPTMYRDLRWLGGVLTVSAGIGSWLARDASFYLSIAVASGALTALHSHAHRLNGDAVRALADFALLAPLPIMGLAEIVRALAGG